MLVFALLEDLIADAERIIHQPDSGLRSPGRVKRTPPHGCAANVQIRSPSLLDTVVKCQIPLRDINTVTFTAGFQSDVRPLIACPNIIGLGLFVHYTRDQLAWCGQIGPLGEWPARDVLGSG